MTRNHRKSRVAYISCTSVLEPNSYHQERESVNVLRINTVFIFRLILRRVSYTASSEKTAEGFEFCAGKFL